jgi:hypothetical protein
MRPLPLGGRDERSSLFRVAVRALCSLMKGADDRNRERAKAE